VQPLQLGYIVLIVEDLDRALAFYTGLLGLAASHRSGGYAQLVTGPTRLSLYTREAMAATLDCELEAPTRAAPGFEIGFVVDDVDAAWSEAVASGAEAVREPFDRFWGQRHGYLRDPDGHLIELVQNQPG
jgi:lactoylglutathione lyase